MAAVPPSRVQVELFGGRRLAAHLPCEVGLEDNLLGVHEHAVGHRVVVADDGVDQLPDERVRFEAEALDAEGTDLPEQGDPGTPACSSSQRPPSGDPGRLGHAANASGRLIVRWLSLIANSPRRKKAERGSVAIQFGLPRPAFR